MDREKVINAIECCIDGCLCAECDYEGIEGCWNKVLLTDALALLKEQQEEITLMKTVYGDQGEIVGELVRCKDCKYAAPDMACSHETEWGNVISRNRRNPNWFCADGERT